MKNSFLHSTFYILHSYLISASIVLLFFITISPASAAGVQIDPSYHPKNAPTITGEAAESEKNLTVEDARIKFFARIINVILGIVGIIAVFSLINNAWFMIASAGQEEALTQRKKGLKWAIIGLILVILSYSIIRWIVSIPWQAHEAPAPPAPFEKMSVPEGKLPGSTPSVEELKQMDEDKYFQEPDSSPGLGIKTKEGWEEGGPPDIKSEESLEDESKQNQEVQKLESEMEQDKIFKKVDVPEGQFSLPPMK